MIVTEKPIIYYWWVNKLKEEKKIQRSETNSKHFLCCI